jgi:alkanesulfonate monooxygenase SsuD/methylene tetrahydromethanopterin reductase-like flavin-dependent oxidoreductase (luciferase family)
MSGERTFRFGVVVGRPASGEEWSGTARHVEALGYAALLLPDTTYTPSPFPALAAAAAVTTTLHVGPWVLAAPFRSPAVVVRETSALQLLSGGRFELGIGTGRPDAAREAELLGEAWGSAADRIARLVDVVAAVREQASPVPPVVVAGAGPRVLAAPHEADSVALALPPTATLDDVARGADLARSAGRDPELALQLSGVGGRLVGHLARQGLAAGDLADAAAVLSGDADGMAEALLRLRARTGISYLTVAAEHAEAFAPVARVLAGRYGDSTRGVSGP